MNLGAIALSTSNYPLDKRLRTQPKGLVPWFDVPDRRAADMHIVFGHWAALGLLQRDDLSALDTGCGWGNRLTAVRLDRPAKPVEVGR